VRSPGGGDNLFLASIVAVRPDTGEYVWHYQTTPGDTWDFTATQHILLAELEIDGKPRKVLMQAPKNGFFYVIDRATGELISAEPYTAPMTWATHVDMETGRPVETPSARLAYSDILAICEENMDPRNKLDSITARCRKGLAVLPEEPEHPGFPHPPGRP
jgi:glucose dehydrogenase